jgi:hypothetical protein
LDKRREAPHLSSVAFLFIVRSGEPVVSKLGDSGRVIRMAGLKPGDFCDFLGEMTLIEMQNRSASVVAETPTVPYELTARYYKADIHPYVMVMQNTNRELCAAPPRRPSHCRAGRSFTGFNDADSRASCRLRRNCDERNGMQWFSFALREAKVANVSLVRLLQINPAGYVRIDQLRTWPEFERRREGPCVDGSGLARVFFTHAAVVGAAMCSAY